MAMHETPDRPTWPAALKGLKRKCPKCGKGNLFDGYLTVRDGCSECGQDFTHQRADDGPAYLTILIVGHIMAPVLHITFVHWRPEPWVLATVLCSLTVVLCLVLLPRIKGMIVGFQWAKRMHGFGHETS